MTPGTSSNSDNQISFFHEIVRKTTHMGALVIPGGYYVFSLEKTGALAIMIPITLLMIFIDISRLRRWRFWTSFARKIGGALIRHHEMQGDFTGASYILISACLTIALFDKPIAIAALAFIIVGDSFAAIIGRRYGRHRYRPNKTVEGTAGCLLGTLIVAMLLPDILLTVAVGGAVVATVIEAYPFGVDDNIAVPLVSGLFMTFLHKAIIFL
ncbi:MAG: phosphatidate cytidylyltransferase [Candidatus Zixiibacteriota bacterium]|nr:MAG: phosphatidate cytidylyltransferase [candidate division Zixibacteria bacterium]